MNFQTLIMKKRSGGELNEEEIRYFIKYYTEGVIPDYQVSALLMAIYFQGLNERETVLLTREMLFSGETVDLSSIEGIKVDKHSTGGVGDTTSLIVAPLVASCGVPVAKMSGRGLGHTGGTIDKLESIPGFKVELSIGDFIKQVKEHKLALIGQTGNLAPADKKLYSLRDVTATVDNVSLIASSIMSKKLAAGSDAIVLDVKFGNGAFMKTLEDAIDLAETMVGIGSGMGRKVVALVTNMNQPLGCAIGNALEVREALQVLNGEGPSDLSELCISLSSEMIALGLGVQVETARKMAVKNLASGMAMDKLLDFVTAQGGDPSFLRNPEKLPTASIAKQIYPEKEGFISSIDALGIGIAAMRTGAGRETKDSLLDYGAGIVLHKKIGDIAKFGDPLATIHANSDPQILSAMESGIADAFTITPKKPDSEAKLVQARVSENSTVYY